MTYPYAHRAPYTIDDMRQALNERLALKFPELGRTGISSHLFNREYKIGAVIRLVTPDGQLSADHGFIKSSDERWLHRDPNMTSYNERGIQRFIDRLVVTTGGRAWGWAQVK